MEKKRWFSAKVYFIYYYYDKDVVLDIDKKSYFDISYEEIVYLIKASSFEEAIEKGEKKALEYEQDYVNVEDNNVSIRYLKTIDAYDLFGERLTDGVELHSTMFSMDENKFFEYLDNIYPLEDEE